MSDSLKQLLRQADQTPNVPDPRELAARVRRTRKEQVRQHRLVISVAMVLLMSCVVVMWPKSGNRNVAKTSVTETPEATEIDMRLHALTAEALLMSERASRAR